MTDNTSLREAMDTYFATKEEMAELQKAITTTADGSAGDVIPLEYDADILKMILNKAPFIARLRAIGKIKPATSSYVGYRKKTSGAVSSFIEETDAIPAATSGVWEAATALMKILVTPIEVTDLAQKGGQNVVDIYADELQDAILDQELVKNQQIIKAATGDHGFPSLKTIIDTNKLDMTGNAISKNDLRTACNAVILAGGTPTAILTTPEVTAHLEDELYPGIRQVNQTELVTGYNVTAFRAPNGTDIPIITDPAMPNVDGARELYVLDESVLEVRDLMPATTIPLAKTKLTASTVVAQFTTFFCRAETWQYKFYNID